MVAFHFPPMRGSSGAQRTLNFCRHLPAHGWEPRVLTVNGAAHPETSSDQLDTLPPGLVVLRAPALDAARHAAIGGRYPRFLATPDRWATWWPGAVALGMREIHRWRPDVVWSTFPIASAHRIGATLAKLGRLPWVADFRDSMTEEDFPRDARTRAAFRRIEERAVDRAQGIVFTTPGTLRMYAQRYPAIPRERWVCITNGYAEEDFEGAEVRPTAPRADGRVTLLHSGLVYPVERDPRALFTAVAALKNSGRSELTRFRIVLRATGHDEVLRREIKARAIDDIVELHPPIGYREALAEMLAADALLILQAANCNHQIPAKLYEYLRARRPILALTDAEGDTAGALRAGGVDTIAPLDEPERIRQVLERFVDGVRNGTAPLPQPAYAASFSRASQAAELARLLDHVAR
jgi:glycosyltransferase involved in cell wall biosynthesis